VIIVYYNRFVKIFFARPICRRIAGKEDNRYIMFELRLFEKRYNPDRYKIRIDRKEFIFYVPSAIEPFVDPDDPIRNFPLWAKIWEPSLVLAQHLSTIPPEPDVKCLELGAGLGVAGIIASHFGHRVTLTEYDEHAIQFAKANALLNGCKDIEIKKLDWHNPELIQPFDLIFGSEIIYKKEDYESIRNIFERYLAPQGLIILAEGLRRSSVEFFQIMSDKYHIRARKKIMHSEAEKVHLLLCEMRPIKTEQPGT